MFYARVKGIPRVANVPTTTGFAHMILAFFEGSVKVTLGTA